MGTRPREVILQNTAITTAFDATTGLLKVGGQDAVSLQITLSASVTTLTMRVLIDGKTLYKVDSSGTTAPQDITHSTATPESLAFALRFDTRGISTLEIRFKGAVTGTLLEAALTRDGTDNVTPISV